MFLSFFDFLKKWYKVAKNWSKMRSKSIKIHEKYPSEIMLFFCNCFFRFVVDFGSILESILFSFRRFFPTQNEAFPLWGREGHFLSILSDFGRIFGWFWVIFGRLFDDFGVIFGCLLVDLWMTFLRTLSPFPPPLPHLHLSLRTPEHIISNFNSILWWPSRYGITHASIQRFPFHRYSGSNAPRIPPSLYWMLEGLGD